MHVSFVQIHNHVVLLFLWPKQIYAFCCGVQAWSGLQRELAVDMQRLWQRNLGRDDRLVADTSRFFLGHDSLAIRIASDLLSCHIASSVIGPAFISLHFGSLLEGQARHHLAVTL